MKDKRVLRVLLAVHHFPPNFLSGAEWQAYRTAHWLQEQGHDVRVICVESDTHGRVGQLEYKDEPYNDIPVRRLFFNLPLAPDSLRWSFRNPLIEQHLSIYLEEFKPDVLHLISGYLMSGSVIAASRSSGTPTVLMPMDFWFLCPRITLLQPDGSICDVPDDPTECVLCLCQQMRRYRWAANLSQGISNRLLRKLWQHPAVLKIMDKQDTLAALQERRSYLQEMFETTDLVLSNSQFLKEMLSVRGFQTSRFVQLRQGIDTERWMGDGAKEPSPHLRVGYIGQIAKHKGVDVLVRAFKRLQAQTAAPRLLLYGNTEQFPSFTQHLHGLIDGDKRITFAGTFSNEQLLKVHGGLDVLVVPSVWYENSPNVILEAFAAKTPVVASNRGGLAELVQHEGNGLLFQIGDAADLARQLQRIIDQPDLLESLQKGIQPVKTVQNEMEELEQIYRTVAGGQK